MTFSKSAAFICEDFVWIREMLFNSSWVPDPNWFKYIPN